MSQDFKKLVELEKNNDISIGVHRNDANNFWSESTTGGKFLNFLTLIFFIITIITFIKFGLVAGIIALIVTGFYTVIVQKFAVWHVRAKLLGDEDLFRTAFDSGLVTIKSNLSGGIIAYPEDWQSYIVSKESNK